MFVNLGLHQIDANYNIFIIKTGIKSLIVSTFVDDSKIMGPKGSKVIKQVEKKLAETFDIINIGFISFYLSLIVEKNCIKKFSSSSHHPILRKFKPNNTLIKPSYATSQ